MTNLEPDVLLVQWTRGIGDDIFEALAKVSEELYCSDLTYL